MKLKKFLKKNWPIVLLSIPVALYLGYYLLLFSFFWLEEWTFKNRPEQQAFVQTCSELNGQALTLENVLKLNGTCLEIEGSKSAGFKTCTEKHLTQQLNDGYAMVVSSDGMNNVHWTCLIKDQKGKMETKLEWYSD